MNKEQHICMNITEILLLREQKLWTRYDFYSCINFINDGNILYLILCMSIT